MPTVADALVATLHDWNVGYVFGVSGANIEHLHDSIHRTGGTGVQSIMARSEVGAAFMADARARVRGTLGVCCATSGGGMMNLAVGLAESYADSVPVLAIVGQPPTAQHGRGAFQDGSGIGRTVNAEAMFASMTKHVETISDPALFWEQLETAARTALSGRPGPAVLLVPRDLWDQQVADRPVAFPSALADVREELRTADAASLAALQRAIADARHPVVIAGPGARRSVEALRVFAESAGIPVMTTMADLAVFPHDHRLYRGMVGAAGHPSAHSFVNEHADLVIAVGTTLDIMSRAAVGPGLERAKVAVLDVDTDLAERALRVDIAVPGDIESTLMALAAELSATSRQPDTFTATRYVAVRDESVPTTDWRTKNGERAELTTSEAVSVLQRYLPRNGNVLFDAGNCAATALHHLDVPESTTTTIALGQGGMGYALAGGVGVALGSSPDERTVVLCGDGAFLMLGTEVHTAVDLQLPLLYVVFNDNRHGMCVTRQGLFFDGREECVSYADVDIAAVARGFGTPDRLWVRQARTPQQVLTALAEYHADGGRRPGVLELCISVAEMPPFAPFLGADAPVIAVRPATAEGIVAA